MRGRDERDGLDEVTVERLLSGEDVRDGGADVRRLSGLLAAAREPLPPDPARAAADEDAVLAAFRAQHARPEPVRAPRRRILAGALTGIAALLALGGVAVASGGVPVPGFGGDDHPRPVTSRPVAPGAATPTPNPEPATTGTPTPLTPAVPAETTAPARESAALCRAREHALAKDHTLPPGQERRLADAAHGQPLGPYCARVLREDATHRAKTDEGPQGGTTGPVNSRAGKDKGAPGNPGAPGRTKKSDLRPHALRTTRI
ncbi:hypothetical protein SRB5_60960 [Streptomyces sp. RB5]|uniref:Uncharacterized protein n=1 Tax=Streptomyces smaragdinus TaxID=2585196 RepID=A0A7K0CT55_9ACTN|nr:hypothetical protein [Streptomyces smaragdinus]MQY15904.1 hypothetical protein [Streptomyces smaragdinus]